MLCIQQSIRLVDEVEGLPASFLNLSSKSGLLGQFDEPGIFPFKVNNLIPSGVAKWDVIGPET